MNDRYLTLANTEDSPELLKGVLWALSLFSAIVIGVLLSGLAIQRGKMIIDERGRFIAEQQRNAAYNEKSTEVRNLNGELMKAQSARLTAENRLEAALSAKARYEDECNEFKAQRDQFQRELVSVQSVRTVPVSTPFQSPPAPAQAPEIERAAPSVSPPTAEAITTFVREHLAKMCEPEAGLGDYAEQVDFHDKPNASLQDIANDRERWAQKWPRRIIQMSGAMPEIQFNKDSTYQWQALVALQWHWQFVNRMGMMLRGVYRDTWKIVPTAQGMKIISEHSVDAATGRSRD